MVTALVARSCGIGGRSLRIVTRTALHPLDRQQLLGDALGDALEQEVRLGRHHPLGDGGGAAVVDRVVQSSDAPGDR